MCTIYVFSDENLFPVYVGKAKIFKKRISQHLNSDRFKYDTWFYRWLNKQIRENKEFYIDILEEFEDYSLWQEKEKYWIKHIREHNYELTNMTDGGDGNNNQICSEATKLKRSNSLKGRKVSIETRNKISEKHKGKIIKESTKDKLRQFNLGKPCLQSTKDKFSKKVEKYDLNNNLIEIYKSLLEASNSIGCRKSTLSNVINRKKNGQFKEYIWKYS